MLADVEGTPRWLFSPLKNILKIKREKQIRLKTQDFRLYINAEKGREGARERERETTRKRHDG